MSEFYDLIFDAALSSRNEILTNDSEYQNLMKQLTDLSEEYKKLELTKEQRSIIDEMVQTEDLINEKEMQAIYKKGILNCIDILRDLKLIE